MTVIPRLPGHPQVGVPLFEARVQVELVAVKAELLRLLPDAQPVARELTEVIVVVEKARGALASLEGELVVLLEHGGK